MIIENIFKIYQKLKIWHFETLLIAPPLPLPPLKMCYAAHPTKCTVIWTSIKNKSNVYNKEENFYIMYVDYSRLHGLRVRGKVLFKRKVRNMEPLWRLELWFLINIFVKLALEKVSVSFSFLQTLRLVPSSHSKSLNFCIIQSPSSTALSFSAFLRKMIVGLSLREHKSLDFFIVLWFCLNIFAFNKNKSYISVKTIEKRTFGLWTYIIITNL